MHSSQLTNDELYFAAVRSRMREAETVEFLTVALDGWEPQESKCHENVDFYAAHNRSYEAVRGWLTCGPGILIAHSVLRERASGKLYDITPPAPDAARLSMRFIRHFGTEEEFLAIRSRHPQHIDPFSL